MVNVIFTNKNFTWYFIRNDENDGENTAKNKALTKLTGYAVFS